MTPLRILVVLTAAGLLAAVAAPAGAGGGGGGGPCRAFAEGGTLVMRDSCFEGIAHEVEAGDTLRVVNQGQLPHTITAIDGRFDSGTVPPGGSYELTLPEPGTYRIYCTLHGTTDGAGMAGLVLAVGATAAAEPTTSADAPPAWLLLVAVVAIVAAAIAARRWGGHRSASAASAAADQAAGKPTGARR